MSQSLSNVYVHITFSTKHRYPFIDDKIKSRLWDYLGGTCKRLECYPIQIGGYNDHIHILCTLSKKITQAKLIEEIKRASSLWMKTIHSRYYKFYWQDGYGIFSVNPSELGVVVEYIKNQEEHHRKRSFKEEMMAFLRKYKMDYNEKYLFD
ncbi:IS200/IS605 family transposase [Bacteroidales bacterium OttesenSCG-928-M06]|nr:IS200/IS605 family transposase [Bacteroidales bacterium OttesenSCG-928-M06]